MTNWITLSVPPDITSNVQRTPKLITNRLGDGYIVRTPNGINNNPAVYTISYKHLKPSDHADLLEFVNEHAALGTALTVKLLPEDPSGATTGLFFIQSSTTEPHDGGVLFDWSITLQQIFGA